jgi:predicted NAD/FAD-dependent oxidoreductase
LHKEQGGWSLFTEAGECFSGFASVVLTIPPVQAEQLLAGSGMANLFDAPHALLEPCWAVAVGATGTIALNDAIFCQHPKLRFISHQQHKTGRYSGYILHFSAAYTREHLEEPATFWFDEARKVLVDDLGLTGDLVDPQVAHRWLYASQNDQLPPPGLTALPEQQLWIGGDWCYGGRVENAYLCGMDLAKALMNCAAET